MAEFVRAVVQKIVQGEHGAFVVTSHNSEKYRGSITFSLNPTVWKEARWPQPGEIVILNNFREKRSGWRAESATFSTRSEPEKSRSPSLAEKICNMGQPFNRTRDTGVLVSFTSSPAVARQLQQVNRSLFQATEEERFQLTRELFQLWVDGKQRYEEARQVFGELFKQHGAKPLILTLNTDRRQVQSVKVWYDLPTFISSDEIGGNDCLLTVKGSTAVDRYLREFLKIYPIRRNSLKNGARVWINWG